MKYTLLTILVVAAVLTPWLMQNYPQALVYLDGAYTYVGKNLTAALIHNPVTVAELQKTYNSGTEKKIKVLIVPGHEPDFGGTEFRDLKERDMNVELADDLAGFLKNNGHYDVIMARDKKNWNPVLADYFKNHWDEIISFFKTSKADELHLISLGKSISNNTSKIYHNKAPENVAYRLYGINKWENENDVDIAIHVHFNDYPRANASAPGEYSGFAIYVPERIYSNSTTTRVIANTVFKRLAKYNPVSNLPVEDNGVIEEPDLIAIGAHNTADAASMLIEYGYIYEPEFTDPKVRDTTMKDLAFQTYLGLQDFFGSGNDVSFAYDTLVLPHEWKSTLTQNSANTNDIYALQTAMLLDGVYPGNGNTKNDCPRTGKFGPCTLSALTTFQKKYGIKGEEGKVGEKTQKLLNTKFSVQKAI